VLFYAFRGLEIVSLTFQSSYYGADRDQFAGSYMFQTSTYLLVVLVPPILTMRLFAEEKRTGSLEVLLTAPVRDVDIVLGKWAATWIYFMLLLLPNVLLLWILQADRYLGVELPFGPVLAGYLGIGLLGSMLLALGCFLSSLTDNQLLASLAGILGGLALMNVSQLAVATIPEQSRSAVFARLLEQANVSEHLGKWFGRGLIDTSHVTFYVVGTAFFLFLCVQSLESRRWR
jgi:ABC-2 type transport system permease protein